MEKINVTIDEDKKSILDEFDSKYQVACLYEERMGYADDHWKWEITDLYDDPWLAIIVKVSRRHWS